LNIAERRQIAACFSGWAEAPDDSKRDRKEEGRKGRKEEEVGRKGRK